MCEEEGSSEELCEAIDRPKSRETDELQRELRAMLPRVFAFLRHDADRMQGFLFTFADKEATFLVARRARHMRKFEIDRNIIRGVMRVVKLRMFQSYSARLKQMGFEFIRMVEPEMMNPIHSAGIRDLCARASKIIKTKISIRLAQPQALSQ